MDISGPRVTPSRPDYWTGTPTDSGLTVEQIESKRRLAGKLAIAQQRYRLPAQYLHRMVLERGGSVSFWCPVLSCTRDRARLCVIAPNGKETWVDWKGERM